MTLYVLAFDQPTGRLLVTEAPKDRTLAGFLAFLEWAGRTGELNQSTARAFGAAVRQVVAIEDDADNLDVTTIDVDAMLARWENLNRTRYSAGSLATYRSRFRQSLAMYAAWLNKDPAWKQAGKAQPKQGTKAATTTGRPRKLVRTSTDTAPPATDTADTAVAGTSAGVRLVAYDLPLRPDLLVRLNLPVDLTSSDAARIATFVKSLAFDAVATPETSTTKSVVGSLEGGG